MVARIEESLVDKSVTEERSRIPPKNNLPTDRVNMIYLLLLFICVGCLGYSEANPLHKDSSPYTLYKDASQPITSRVADLVSRMTLDELIAAVAHKDGDTDADLRQVYGNTSIGGVKITLFTVNGNGPRETILARNAFQSFMIQNSRLNIPVSVAHEGLHSGSFFGTVFPQPLLTACTWNDSLVEKIGAVLGDEARAYGVDNSWSPVVNMWQDDRFGRFQVSR